MTTAESKPCPTAADLIVDCALTEKEAFDGLDPQCPSAVREQQKLVCLLYHGFDGKVHRGQLVLARDLEKDIQEIFAIIRKARFPICSVLPLSLPRFRKEGRWDDDLSMAANNTSAFNFRTITGSTRLSKHAYGRAIDINPVQNPYVKGTRLLPKGATYDPCAPGTLTADHVVVKAFVERGWEWGGNWKTLKDYQHFEKPLPRPSPPP